MPKLILSTILMLFSFSFFAFAEKVDASLESITALISKKDNFKTEFTQIKHLKKLNKDFKGTGSLFFAKKLGIIWQTSTPVKTTFVLTDKQILQVNSDNKVQKVDTSKNVLFSKFSKILQSVFAGNPSEIANNFTYNIVRNPNETKLMLAPKEQNVRSVIGSLEITLHEYISDFTIIEPNGDSTKYILQNIISPYELSENENQFFVQ